MSQEKREGLDDRGPSEDELSRAVPERTGTHELRIGIFVLAGILSILGVLYLATDPATFRGRYFVTTQVDDALGLRKGDPVQMRGVNVGRVHDFRITDEGVIITTEIEGEYDVPADSRTRLVTTSLLGGKTVEIIPGDSDEMAREGTHLPGARQGDIFESTSELTGNAQEVLVRVRELLSEPTVSSIQASARELQSLLTSLNELTESQRDDVAALAERLNSAAQGMEEVANSRELRQAIARADSTLVTLNRTSVTLRDATESLRVILGRMERGEGTLGRLSMDDTLYDDLSRTLSSLDELLVDIRENPGRYIKLEIF